MQSQLHSLTAVRSRGLLWKRVTSASVLSPARWALDCDAFQVNHTPSLRLPPSLPPPTHNTELTHARARTQPNHWLEFFLRPCSALTSARVAPALQV